MCNLAVDAGICGFQCEVEIVKKERCKVAVNIYSECPQLQKLNEMLDSLELRDIFKSPNKNIAFTLSEKAGCHTSCIVPLAILKCAEVEMGFALPRDVMMNFRV